MKKFRHCTRRRFIRNTATAAACAGLTRAWTFSGLATETFSPPVAVFSKVYQEVKLTFQQSAEVTAQAGLDGIDCAVRAGGEILPEHAVEEMPRYADELQKHKVRMLLLTTGITGISSPHAEDILRTGKKLGLK